MTQYPYRLEYIGGPNDGETDASAHVPDVVPVKKDGRILGSYVLTKAVNRGPDGTWCRYLNWEPV